MAARKSAGRRARRDSGASIWIDTNQAVIIRSTAGRPAGVEVLIRLPAESEGRFEARAADEVLDVEQVRVAGPAAQQVGFDRAFVALTHRPDRLVAASPMSPADSSAS
jgi:hypothetical protein